MGNLDQADKHFKSSLAFYRSAGYRPELTWAYCDYAETLLNRSAEGAWA